MQIIIPMAGLGQRFRDAGYTEPKPLIPVDGEPMVARVVRDLPTANRIVFVVHPEHVRTHSVDRVLCELFPQGKIVVAPGLTAGQACSVRLGVDLLDPNEEVIVASCDNTVCYDREKLRQMTADQGTECLIWTYRGRRHVQDNPHWYGWVRTNERDEALHVSVKRPISDTPLQDHVISGTFWFRSARVLAESIDALVASNERVNNEFYLDSAPNVLRRHGRLSKVFEVDRYIGWGTPAELDAYLAEQRMEGAADVRGAA